MIMLDSAEQIEQVRRLSFGMDIEKQRKITGFVYGMASL